jgi:soluble lytic murein transglycosylase-like protein
MNWNLVKKDLTNTMKYNDRWDSLIQYWAGEFSGDWKAPDGQITQIIVPWKLIKSQVKQESAFNPLATSTVGAKGLLQLMPATDLEIDNETDAWNPDGNVKDGIEYLVDQYIHLPEIDTKGERWKFSLGAYNGGRGYINKALEMARNHGERHWQEWDVTSPYLKSEFCVVNGKTPDHLQITGYVANVWAGFVR